MKEAIVLFLVCLCAVLFVASESSEIAKDHFIMKRVHFTRVNVGQTDKATGYNVILFPLDLTVHVGEKKEIVITKDGKAVNFVPMGLKTVDGRDSIMMKEDSLGFTISFGSPGKHTFEAMMPDDTIVIIHFEVMK